MLDMGFGPEMDALSKAEGMPRAGDNRVTAMFSATFPSEVQAVARRMLAPKHCMITIGFLGGANSDIKQSFVRVRSCSHFRKNSMSQSFCRLLPVNIASPKSRMCLNRTLRSTKTRKAVAVSNSRSFFLFHIVYVHARAGGTYTKKTLVFTETKLDADFLGGRISTAGLPATSMHG